MQKRTVLLSLLLHSAVPLSASAGTIIFPSEVGNPAAPRAVIDRLQRPVTGTGIVMLRWSDALGRVVEERQWPVTLAAATDISFTIEQQRAVTTVNELTVHLNIDCHAADCENGHADDVATAKFAVPPWGDDWWDYQIIMWQSQTPQGYDTLKTIGVTGAKLMAKDRLGPVDELRLQSRHSSESGDDGTIHLFPDGRLSLTGGLEETLLDKDVRWYEENIATDFFSPYHRWFPDKPVNWKYLEAKAAHRKDPSSLQPFMRDPSLSDPDWRATIRDRLTRIVHAQMPFRPLFYNLGDETGIADLAAYWDFDYSRPSLDAFRRSLQERYGTLAALNHQWASSFGRWQDVMPLTAAAAIHRHDENFSAWADFREWMDRTFAGALAEGRDAVHAADPRARAAIEGGQVPGWGGYDYALLAQAVDVFELYDWGNNVDLVHSFNPKAAILTTSFSSGSQEKWRVWRELLHGSRGLVLWDESAGFVNADGRLGERGIAAADYFTELHTGLGALLANSDVPSAPIAIHYSSASMRANWILQERKEGDKGLERASRPDHPDDDFTRLRQSVTDLFAELGQPYRFLSTRQIEDGALRDSSPRVLVLPRSIALSAAEVQAIHQFVRSGGRVIAVGQPGLFDEHVRKRRGLPFKEIFARGDRGGNLILASRELIGGHRGRKRRRGEALRQEVGQWLRKSGVVPGLDLVDGVTGKAVENVDVRVLHNGAVSIVGLLGAVAPSPTATEVRALRVFLPAAACGYDVREKLDLGCRQQFDVALKPFEPVILALSPRPIEPLSVSVPETVGRGKTVEIRIVRQPEVTATSVFHIDVVDPAGHTVSYYSGNLMTSDGAVHKNLPLAQNEQPGNWAVHVTDVLTGRRQDVSFRVTE